MKGFPNQVADLGKHAAGMAALLRLVEQGENPRDDDVYGVALVRSGVAGTGHTPKPVEEYIREQRQKSLGNQSHRATARLLRQLYRLLGLISDRGEIEVTELGRQAASFAGLELDAEQKEFWRRVMRNFTHTDAHGNASHPYQVLLRLVGRKPGITRAKCALALEARDDSRDELDRIANLADLTEDEIRERIGATKSNWDNAKKILPGFAEQLGDVLRRGESFFLADTPGAGEPRGREEVRDGVSAEVSRGQRRHVRVPRASREVSAATIGRAGTEGTFDEVEIPRDVDREALAAAIALRRDRLRRHNLLVKELASRFEPTHARLYEDPMDILALLGDVGALVEVKTLDGTEEDERERVRDALGQLLYYEAFVTIEAVGDAELLKVACFEGPISDAHRGWLNRSGIGVIWRDNTRFVGDQLAREYLGAYIEELQ